VTKNKGRVAQEARLKDMTVFPAETDERWYPPDPEHCESYPVTIVLPPNGRIKGRMDFDESDRMTEFSLTSQVWHADAWWDVVRVDSYHAEVHIHYFYRTRSYEDREVIFPIRNQNDVDRGYLHAERMLVACWFDHERRWRDGN
jgi:hypothetical protein